ncbi:MAG: hypothetical protein WCK67_06920 [bacterium]
MLITKNNKYNLAKPSLKKKEHTILTPSSHLTKAHLNYPPLSTLKSYNISFRNMSELDISKKINSFFDDIKYENAFYWEYLPEENKEVSKKNQVGIKKLDNFFETLKTDKDKKAFISAFKEKTGFPKFDKVSSNMVREALNGINAIAERENFEILFMGYDKNSSVGQKMPFPGSDCDGMIFVIDSPDAKKKAPYYRWLLSKNIDQRILSTNVTELPEVMSLEEIKEGVEKSNIAFTQYLKTQDTNEINNILNKFKTNIETPNKDYIEAADFNIQISKYINPEDKWLIIKTALFAELIRDGIVEIDGLNQKFKDLLNNSAVYKYSNMQQQRALSDIQKDKIIARKELSTNFEKMQINEQFNLIKDIIYKSFDDKPSKNSPNSKYFYNIGTNAFCESGNIVELYKQLSE